MNNWFEANQQYLSRALEGLRERIEHHIARAENKPLPERKDTWQELEEIARTMSQPPALEAVCAAFSLSPFEREMLLLCSGIELDARFAPLCAAAQGNATRTYPTFSLALAALPDSHWSALAPDAALRRWHLIEVAGAGESLTISPLRIDERMLHYLAGVPGTDERLRGLVEPVNPTGDLAPSHTAVAEKIADLWSGAPRAGGWPIVQLCGRAGADKLSIVAAAASKLGMRLHKIHARDVPPAAREREILGRLWEREAVLTGSALVIDVGDLDGNENAHSPAAFAENIGSIVLISAREPVRISSRFTIRIDVAQPAAGEQRALWQAALGSAAEQLNGELENVLAHFDLDTRGIHAVCAELAGHEQALDGGTIWDICRAQSRPQIGTLAQRIEPVATWIDIVLPEAQLRTLREIALHVHRRGQVYNAWGFAAKSSRGLGISALFAGPSGTGKTMAAEVLANHLRLDLYRIDLSQVVSKYIGETEKNLRRVFEAAEGSGAILLFDEADALFGKRSEVKDSHDRYANIEVSYLLQQMEAYRGLAILTTNMKNALDPAFLRRIRFVAQFPFPDAPDRAEIWRRIFPAETPTDHLEIEKLARLNVAGGNIRNIALNAAFLAAGAGEPVRMNHLLRAVRSEYEKIEKPLTESEIGGWK
jgi:ATP-dependent 26S proteasome regulatory subunit